MKALRHPAAMTFALHRHRSACDDFMLWPARNHDRLPRTVVSAAGARVVKGPSTTRGEGDDPKSRIERPGP
jgi:hypothetical protein